MIYFALFNLLKLHFARMDKCPLNVVAEAINDITFGTEDASSMPLHNDIWHIYLRSQPN